MFIRVGVDNPDFAIVLTGILTAVSHIEKSAMGIVRDTVGSQIQLDRVQQVERVAAEYTEHPVISTGNDHFIDGTNISDPLSFLQTRLAFHPFAHLKRN